MHACIGVKGWDQARVQVWLVESGLAQFAEAFAVAGVDGAWLLDNVNDQKLEQLGISHKMHRKKIQQRIEMLPKD